MTQATILKNHMQPSLPELGGHASLQYGMTGTSGIHLMDRGTSPPPLFSCVCH